MNNDCHEMTMFLNIELEMDRRSISVSILIEKLVTQPLIT